jgi:hypothetical protein
MPVSKKRKNDGKPVHRSVPAPAPQEPGDAPAVAPADGPPQQRMGRPTNPFVASPQGRRASQRGR